MTAPAYEPGEDARRGVHLANLVRRLLRLQEHLWVATAMWSVDPTTGTGPDDPMLLDQENLLVAPVVGCYVCEVGYSPCLARRRCPSNPGPAPLLPGRSR